MPKEIGNGEAKWLEAMVTDEKGVGVDGAGGPSAPPPRPSPSRSMRTCAGNCTRIDRLEPSRSRLSRSCLKISLTLVLLFPSLFSFHSPLFCSKLCSRPGYPPSLVTSISFFPFRLFLMRVSLTISVSLSLHRLKNFRTLVFCKDVTKTDHLLNNRKY